jgi:hypothetical protein
MNSEQKIFFKMTSFSLLNFKFTQIFLMGQNGFLKWPNYRWIRLNYRRMRPNFNFLKDHCSFHTSNMIRSNFNEFIDFSFFQKINRISHLHFFFAAHEFSNTARRSVQSWSLLASNAWCFFDFFLHFPASWVSEVINSLSPVSPVARSPMNGCIL